MPHGGELESVANSLRAISDKDNGEISKIANNLCKARLAIPPRSADLRTLVGFPVGYHGCCDFEGVDEVFPYG